MRDAKSNLNATQSGCAEQAAEHSAALAALPTAGRTSAPPKSAPPTAVPAPATLGMPQEAPQAPRKQSGTEGTVAPAGAAQKAFPPHESDTFGPRAEAVPEQRALSIAVSALLDRSSTASVVMFLSEPGMIPTRPTPGACLRHPWKGIVRWLSVVAEADPGNETAQL